MQTRLTCATTFAVLSAFKVCLLFVPVIEPLLIHHPLCEEVLEVWHGFSGQDGEFVGDYCEHDLSCNVPGTKESERSMSAGGLLIGLMHAALQSARGRGRGYPKTA